MDALVERGLTGRLDSRKPVAQDCGQDRDHLPVAIGGGELAADPVETCGRTQFLNGAPFRSAPGFLASTDT